jgi:CheY-like chemotaxis protein
MSTFLTKEILIDYFENIRIHSFTSGEDCLKYLTGKVEKFILLVDINMPEMNGWEFLDLYRNLGMKHKFFFLTSSINDDDRKRAEKGHVCFLNKPLNPSFLVDLINSSDKDENT